MTPQRPPNNDTWTGEARVLASTSLAVALAIFAHAAIATLETLFVARLGTDALAGMTLGLSLYTLAYLFSLGIVTAITPIAATAHGRRDVETLRLSAQQGVLAGLTFAVPGTVLLLLVGLVLWWMPGGGAPSRYAWEYLAGAAWGLPAWVTYIAVRCVALAVGRAQVTTVVMLLSVPAYAAMAWVMIFGAPGIPAMGVFGAGLAYAVIAYLALAAMVLILRRSRQATAAAAFSRPYRYDRLLYREIMGLGLPIAARILLREGVLPVATAILAPFGAATVAAHAVAVRIVGLASVFGFGLSNAATLRIGHAIGAGTPERARFSAKVAVQLSGGIAAAGALMMIAAPLLLASWVLGDDATPAGLAAAAAVLPVAALYQFLEALQGPVHGVLVGVRDTRGPLVIVAATAWGLGVPLGSLLAHVMSEPVAGFWLGLLAGAVAATFLLLSRMRMQLLRLEALPRPPAQP